jgi:hypothetical protein
MNVNKDDGIRAIPQQQIASRTSRQTQCVVVGQSATIWQAEIDTNKRQPENALLAPNQKEGRERRSDH